MYSNEPERSVKVFISYAHADKELRKKLEEHLSSLKYSGKITIWQDQEIPAGANWEDQINTHLNDADLVLLLTSASFIASKYCWSKEVRSALERHKAGKALVIPIILRPVVWQDTPLRHLQVLPTDAKPVTQWSDHDSAFEDVARGIRDVVEHLFITLREDVERKDKRVGNLTPSLPTEEKPVGEQKDHLVYKNDIGIQRENTSTYIVQDRENREEMVRLEIQDTMLTSGMGGVLPELVDPSVLCCVLDVGCGTGGWLMELAKDYPMIEKLVGVDVSLKMMSYARAQAEVQHIEGRVHFYTMDALQSLEFPDASFDLVNHRLSSSWLRTWEWTKLLVEYQRVTRVGGIIRVTEGNTLESNSPAFTKLCDIMLEAFYHAGRFFTASKDGVAGELAALMTQHALQDVKSRLHPLVYRAGTVAGQYFYEDMAHLFRLFLPFFQRWTPVPSDYEEIYQQALEEMQAADFVATWTLLTVWGRKSGEKPMLIPSTSTEIMNL